MLSRGYLSLCQAGAATEEEDDPPPAPPGPSDDSRCMAMMEVVRKDGADTGGKWKVSKFMVHHNHHLDSSVSAVPWRSGWSSIPSTTPRASIMGIATYPCPKPYPKHV
jgi:hypothetical protein